MTIESVQVFSYAGKVRIVRIVENAATYVKAENISCDGRLPERKFSTYAKDKIVSLLTK